MNTRWHEEDVAGRVLEQIKQGVVRGRVISIPAIAEADDVLGRKPGEYLWDDPDGYNYGEFLRARQREIHPDDVVGALPAAAGPRGRRVFQGRVASPLYDGPGRGHARDLWRHRTTP